MIRTIQRVDSKLVPKANCPVCHGDPEYRTPGLCPTVCMDCLEFGKPVDVEVDLTVTRIDGGGAEISFKPIREDEMQNSIKIVASIDIEVKDERRASGYRLVKVSKMMKQIQPDSQQIQELRTHVETMEAAKSAVRYAQAEIEKNMEAIVKFANR